MRWRLRDRERGEQRTVKRFAWVPVRLRDGHRVWFERYLETSEWIPLDAKGDGIWRELRTEVVP